MFVVYYILLLVRLGGKYHMQQNWIGWVVRLTHTLMRVFPKLRETW